MVIAASLGRAVRALFSLALVGLLTVVLIGPIVALLSVAVSLAVTFLAFLLPFAVVGFFIWLPYHVFSGDPRTAWASLSRGFGRVVGQVTGLVARCFRVAGWSLRRLWEKLGVIRPAAQRVTGVAADASAKAYEAARLAAHAAKGASEKAYGAARVYGPVVAGACAHGCRVVAREGEVALAAAAQGSRQVAERSWPWLRYLGNLFLEAAAGAGVGGLLAGVANLDHGFDERIAVGVAVGAFVGLIVGLMRTPPR